MKKLLAGVLAGIAIGSVGTALASSTVVDWKKSQAGIYWCHGRYWNREAGDVKCVSARRDSAGGQLYVWVDNFQVFIGYAHPKRGGPIFGCRVGKEPVGYHGGVLPHWDDCR
jgi:hypothetical protein